MQNTMIPSQRYATIYLIIGLILALAGSAIAISMFKPKHEAKLFFRVIHNREWLICFRSAGETDDQTVASWINSEVISNLVAIDPRVAGLDEIRNAGNPAAKLMAMADVTSEGGNGLFAIAVRSEVPANAALIADTYWEKYNEQQDLVRERQSKQLTTLLDKEIAAYKKQVKLLEMDL